MVDELSLIPWFVWFTPILGALLTPLFASLHGKVRDYAAVLFSLASAILAALLIPTALSVKTIHSQIEWIPSLGIRAGVLADPLSIMMANVVAWISFLIMVYSLGYMHGEANLARYWFFMNFFIGSMQLVVLSDNFLQLFFGWEGVGLCSYALIGFWHSDEEKHWVGTPGREVWKVPQAYSPSHAGMKAFVMTRIGDVAFLIGLFLLYSYAGTFEFLKLSQDTAWAGEMAEAGLLVPAAILIFGGAVGKSAQFPLHEWLPDAMAGPTSVSALIHAATMVKAGVFLVARTGPIFFAAAALYYNVGGFFEVIAWIGVFTAFLAATQAMVSKEVKKVLAYSTVSQIGYMMLALGIGGLAADFVAGYTAGLFHLASHAIFKAAMFLSAGALIHACESKYMDEMGGIRREMKITFFSMMLAMASLSGIPPLSGFWSKDAILASALEASHYPLASLLFIFAALTALITVFYSFRMVGLIFFGRKSGHLTELEKEGRHVHEAPMVMWLPYLLLALSTLAIGLVGPLFEGGLHDILGGYLHATFGIELAEEASGGINLMAVSTSLVVVVIGGYLGYQFYISQKFDATKIVERSSFARWTYRFLENRWYINPFYYRAFVSSTLAWSRTFFRSVETGIIDRFNVVWAGFSVFFSALSDKFDVYVVDGVVNGISKAGVKFSGVAKKVQTGVAEQYIFVFAIGVALVLLVMLVVV